MAENTYDLITRWRRHAESCGHDHARILTDCANELDDAMRTAMAHIKDLPFQNRIKDMVLAVFGW